MLSPDSAQGLVAGGVVEEGLSTADRNLSGYAADRDHSGWPRRSGYRAVSTGGRMTTATNETQLHTTGPGADAVVARPRATELVTPDGKTTIADMVVSKIAGIAAREVPGVHELVGQGMGAAVSGLAQRMTRADARATGVSVEVGEREAAIDFRLTVEY